MLKLTCWKLADFADLIGPITVDFLTSDLWNFSVTFWTSAFAKTLPVALASCVDAAPAFEIWVRRVLSAPPPRFILDSTKSVLLRHRYVIIVKRLRVRLKYWSVYCYNGCEMCFRFLLFWRYCLDYKKKKEITWKERSISNCMTGSWIYARGGYIAWISLSLWPHQ